MNILDDIIAFKQKEVKQHRMQLPIKELEKTVLFNRETFSLKKNLERGNTNGIIAEFKRKSPSKGIINDRNSIEEVTKAYAENGASGISVLTDQSFFGGSLNDLVKARENKIPLLRKDFMIDEYQLYEAKANGADVILLIAACLLAAEVKQMAATAHKLGLEVLLEIHNEKELDHICTEVDMVGVNNRDLKTFKVNLKNSIQLSEKIGDGFIKIAESGISTISDIKYLKQHGFRGFLIGEYFMKQDDPGEAFKNFCSGLK